MKPFLVLLMTTFTLFSMTAQDLSGQWNGVLEVKGMKLRLVFNVSETDEGYFSTMDSPDQGATGIPVTHTTLDNSKVKFEVVNAKIEYNGELNGDEIIGSIRQGAIEMPMNLSRKIEENEPIEKEIISNLQEPTAPFPYESEDITFVNSQANISLAGTLTLPSKEGVFPAVILISGSGPQNRDEELLGHKPFLVIADYLTRNGIAVLRYDDRGVAASKGNFGSANSADFATDVESAIAYLKTRKEINQNKIGLMGHSEGGLIAPMVAARSKDVSFIVLLAGPGIPGNELLLLQQKLIASALGAEQEEIDKSAKINTQLFEKVVNSNNEAQLKSDLTAFLNETLNKDPNFVTPGGVSKDEFISMQVDQITSPWMQYFLKFDPSTTLVHVKCPVLAVNGEKDLQVAAKENLAGIKKSLAKGGNKNVTIKAYPNLNHLFQECSTGLPAEYSTIEQTFSPLVLTEILEWIKLQTK